MISNKVPWHSLVNLEDSSEAASSGASQPQLPIASLERLYTEECEKFSKTLKKSDKDWEATILKTGTTKDKISTLTLRIQANPFYSLDHLVQLMKFAAKKSHRESLLAVESLQDLWLHSLLPDRKLRSLADSRPPPSSHLQKLFLYFEDRLKSKYFEFISILEALSKDNLDFARAKSLSIIYSLLAGKPEQEHNLLVLLVNKLGDSDNKIASKAAWLLNQLLVQHPNMAVVVITEANQLLHRPNISKRAQYYALIFLNQIVLSNSRPEPSARLLQLYFSLFQSLNESKALDAKLLSAILTGLNRVLPFAGDIGSSEIQLHLDRLFKLIHTGNMMASLQSIQILHQMSLKMDNLQDRFYKSVYEFLLDARVFSFSKPSLLLNILYKIIKVDLNADRVFAFVKRILQVSASLTPSFACASLILFSEVIKIQPSLGYLIEKFPAATKAMKNSEASLAVYDPYKRDPQYCGAKSSMAYELSVLSLFFHPSVRKLAQNLLNGDFIEKAGDPFVSFSLSSFLDKFSFKNPKANAPSGSSIMQPPATKHSGTSSQQEAVNIKYSDESAGMSVPPDEEFYSKYFSLSSVKMRLKKRNSAKGDPGEAAEISDFEEEADRILQGSDEEDGNLESSEDEDMEFSEDEAVSEALSSASGSSAASARQMEEGLLSDLDDSTSQLPSGEEFQLESGDDQSEEEMEQPRHGSASSLQIKNLKKKKHSGSTESWVKRAKKMGIDTNSVFLDADSITGLIDMDE